MKRAAVPAGAISFGLLVGELFGGVGCGGATEAGDADGSAATDTDAAESGSDAADGAAPSSSADDGPPPSTSGADEDSGDEGSSTGEPPHMIVPCDEIAGAGTWEHITPAEVSLAVDFPTPAADNFGVHSFVLDPQNTATIYLGTSAQGIYKSEDCGATWVHINTGTNAETLDGGRQWTFQIDPVDSQVLYTNTGYGSNGAWKSTNGAVDWNPFIDHHLAALQFGGFVHHITMDPTDHEHLIVTPHFECEVGAVDGLPLTPSCLLETKDGGATWDIREGTPAAGEGAGQWMQDADTWFWAEGFPGLWRTGDAGASWQHVYDEGYATAGAFTLDDGTIFTGGVFSVLTSTDGGLTWSSIPKSPGADVVTGDQDTIYVSRNGLYHSAPAADPTAWTQLPTPAFPDPSYVVTWDFLYDPDHHLLYSLNSRNGFWRYPTR
jgi:hypothetical protein